MAASTASAAFDFMGKLHELQASIDSSTRDIAVLNRISESTRQRRSTIVLGGGVLAFLFVFLGFGASFFSHLVGFAYPAYASFKAIETPSARDDKQWLTYWIVFAVFAIVESFSDSLLFWFPLYYSVKICFLMFCQLPQFQGATFIYESFLRPLFLRHAPAIERQVEHFRNVSDTVSRLVAGPVDTPVPAPEPRLSNSQLFGESAGEAGKKGQ